jgi:hypothetical protein
MRRHARWLLICIVIGGCETRTGDKVMANPAVADSPLDFDDALREEPFRVPVKPVEIRPATKKHAPGMAEPAPQLNATGRAFASETMNSRTAGAIGLNAFEVRWKTDLKQGLNAAYVLHSADRLLLPGEYEWQLFTRDGKAVASGARGAGEVVMHEPSGVFYVPDPAGTIAAQQLADGKRTFAMNAYSGKQFRRSLIFPQPNRLTIVSVEYLKQPHSRIDPNFSALEIFDLGTPPQVNQFGLLASAEAKVRLTRGSTLLLAAATNESVVVAIENCLFIADRELRGKAVLTGEFTPTALSLDEAGRMYVVVRTAERQALWIVSPQGERLAAIEFGDDVPPIVTPPAVGYDHRAYVTAGEKLLAIEPDGKVAWETAAPGRVFRIAVTSDNQLIAASGKQLIAIDAKGESRTLMTLESGAFQTPPVVSAQGDVFVASATQLYCLTRRQAAATTRSSTPR